MLLRAFGWIYTFNTKEAASKACNYLAYVRTSKGDIEEFENILSINDLEYAKKLL